MIEERDVRIPMRDGVRVALDVYRPEGEGPFPVLYATSMHNEDLQAPDTTGTGAVTDVEYIPYHVCRSETVTHTIYYDAEHALHLLFPVIPKSYRPPPQRSRLQ
jgi:hypothetical protein